MQSLAYDVCLLEGAARFSFCLSCIVKLSYRSSKSENKIVKLNTALELLLVLKYKYLEYKFSAACLQLWGRNLTEIYLYYIMTELDWNLYII